MIFCAVSPAVLSGSAGLVTDLTLLASASPFVIVGLRMVGRGGSVRGGSVRRGMVVLVPGLYLLAGIATLRTQLILFHVGRGFALVDRELAALDAAIGFDWPGYFDGIVAHPILFDVLAEAYRSIWYQPFILTGLFIWARRVADYARLQIALPLSFALTCAVATLLPALGAYPFHRMTPDRHAGLVPTFTDRATAALLWLRQADLPAVMPTFAELRLISFPSWHASAAVVFILSAWSLPGVRWLAILLNGLMLAATPVQGSHHLSDVIVGGGIGAVAVAAGTWLLAVTPPARLGRRVAGPAGA